MKKIALLSLLFCFSVIMSFGQSNWIRIDKHIPYPRSSQITFTVTIDEGYTIDTIGGEAELFWTWSGNKVTCTTTAEGFKKFVQRQGGAVPRFGFTADGKGSYRTYVIYFTYDPWFASK
ncbi:hypothetical protein [Dysgonomonas sp. ZJ709]|uniref:hypothetical protein n=1 Tax=Dysgonomonas sp. ZJ709 TaxID=2709797 RepID=UPI0013EBFE14|nr:hypothetical protein [Dysgonomonas sp. ZJ709]